jgi:excisionase family DNA binding protein
MSQTAFRNTEETDKLLLDVKETAYKLGISVRTLYRLLAEDPSLPRIRIGSRLLIPSYALTEWIAQRAVQQMFDMTSDEAAEVSFRVRRAYWDDPYGSGRAGSAEAGSAEAGSAEAGSADSQRDAQRASSKRIDEEYDVDSAALNLNSSLENFMTAAVKAAGRPPSAAKDYKEKNAEKRSKDKMVKGYL